MKFYIFRNSTVENIFGNAEFAYSGYNDITSCDYKSDVYIWFYMLPVGSNPDLLKKEIQSYFQAIQLVSKNIPKNCLFLIFTLDNFSYTKFQYTDFTLETELNNFNQNIIHFANEHENVRLFDISEFARKYPNDQLVDWKYYYISKMILNPQLAKPFKYWFHNKLEKIQYVRKKCVILDLDNTLWGGILGEEGIEGIKIGGDYPGNAFLMFQESLIQLTKIGVILAICSKNNEQDVLEALEKNPYIKLKLDYFSSYRMNWNNKADNIKQIATELNIGLDSIVFVDDNPAERELVKAFLPEVAVPDFPEQPYQLPHFFDLLLQRYFAVYETTDEDRLKTLQYKANKQRNAELENFTDFTDYLEKLEIKIEIYNANKFNINRIAQLTQKTNQFNLTTKRYSESDILNFLEHNDLIYCMNASDKFGDNGLTGLIIIKKHTSLEIEIDSFLMSCRILGKDIETAFLNEILRLLKSSGIQKVTAKYIQTPKNRQVENFYDKAGFKFIKEQYGIRSYALDLQNTNPTTISHIKIEKS